MKKWLRESYGVSRWLVWVVIILTVVSCVSAAIMRINEESLEGDASLARFLIDQRWILPYRFDTPIYLALLKSPQMRVIILCTLVNTIGLLWAVDRDRNAVSLISSIFMAFGSCMVVDGTGIVLQNRGNSFSLDPKHPNRIEPHKRPMHTIIPGMVFKDGKFLMSFGVMGGDMQPQGHV